MTGRMRPHTHAHTRMVGTILAVTLAVPTHTSSAAVIISARYTPMPNNSLAFGMSPARTHTFLGALRFYPLSSAPWRSRSLSAKPFTSRTAVSADRTVLQIAGASANSRRVSGCEPWGWGRGRLVHTSSFRLHAAFASVGFMSSPRLRRQVWMLACEHTH